jgi:hypothetical protein
MPNTRKNRGVFSSLYSPVSGIVRTAGNVAHSGLNTAYTVPATFAKGAKNTVRNSLNRLVSGVDNIGQKATTGINRSLSSAFTRKNRKASRKNRKASRKNRKASRKNRKASRKNRKVGGGVGLQWKPSRKNRKANRKNRKASRKNRKNRRTNRK